MTVFELFWSQKSQNAHGTFTNVHANGQERIGTFDQVTQVIFLANSDKRLQVSLTLF